MNFGIHFRNGDIYYGIFTCLSTDILAIFCGYLDDKKDVIPEASPICPILGALEKFQGIVNKGRRNGHLE